MKIIGGSLLVVMGGLSLVVCFLGARNPREPWWTRESIMGMIIVPLALGAAVLGAAMFINEVINSDAEHYYDYLIALAILGAGVVLTLAMRIRKRLSTYEAMRSSPEIIELKARRKTGRKPLPTDGGGSKRAA